MNEQLRCDRCLCFHSDNQPCPEAVGPDPQAIMVTNRHILAGIVGTRTADAIFAVAASQHASGDATARVIAAAPELLDALRALVKEIRLYHPTFDAHKFVAAERAIAKAEGR